MSDVSLISDVFVRSRTIWSSDKDAMEILQINNYPQEDLTYLIPGKDSVSRSSCGVVYAAQKCADTGSKSCFHDWCYRPNCPICFPAWAKKRAQIMAKTAFGLAQYYKLYHWWVSFDHHLPVQEMKKIVKEIFPDCYCWFHPYRLKDANGNSPKGSNGKKNPEFDVSTAQWRLGRHFHIITTVNYLPTLVIREHYQNSINLGLIRRIDDTVDSYERILGYELSHVSIYKSAKGHIRAHSWAFGIFSNNGHRFLKRVKLSHVNVRCSCEQCQTKIYRQDRAFSLQSDIDIVNIEKYENIVRTEFRSWEEWFPKMQSFIFYLPVKQGVVWESYDQYFRALGIRDHQDDIRMILQVSEVEEENLEDIHLPNTVKLQCNAEVMPHIHYAKQSIFDDL